MHIMHASYQILSSTTVRTRSITLRERHECIPLPEPVDPGFYQSPAQETGCGEDEDNDDRFILERIALYGSVSTWTGRTHAKGERVKDIRKQVVNTSSSPAFLHMGRL